jgi:hypothetical protein
MTVILKFKLPQLVAMTATLLLSLTLAADPTRPDTQLQLTTTAGIMPAATPAAPKLSMIRSQGPRHQALIDGQWLKSGEKIGAYQVRSISASQVILVQGDRSLVLNLFQTTTTTK